MIERLTTTKDAMEMDAAFLDAGACTAPDLNQTTEAAHVIILLLERLMNFLSLFKSLISVNFICQTYCGLENQRLWKT